MESTIYDKLNEAVACKGFLETAERISSFSEAVLCEKNKKTPVKHFYEHLYHYGFQFALIPELFPEQNSPWSICSGNQATATYFALCMPKQSTPVASLRAIHRFAQDTLSAYIPPVGSCLTIDRIREILTHLDTKYDFSRKVFSLEQKPVFCLLNVSHKTCDAQYAPAIAKEHTRHFFFLYHTNGTTPATPEDVFLHELGHSLHTAYIERTEGICASKLVSDGIIQSLHEIGLPSFDGITADEQVELIAELLHVGMLYDTAYPTCDPMCLLARSDRLKLAQKMNAFFRKILSALD